MNKSNVSNFVKGARLILQRNSPEILTGIGIAGMITTTVLAVKATPKAVKIIEEFEESVLLDHEKIKPIDAVKLTWKYYIPSAVTGAISIACLIGASSVNAKRYTALTTAYKLSETALTEYRDKVVETIGEKKEQTVRDAIAKDKIDNNPVIKQEIIITGKGDTLCYDQLSDRYFKSDIDKLKRAEVEINNRMFEEMYISLNDFYTEIGLKETDLGEELGWDINKNGRMKLYFSSQLTEDGTPCLVIEHENPPRYDYRY